MDEYPPEEVWGTLHSGSGKPMVICLELPESSKFQIAIVRAKGGGRVLTSFGSSLVYMMQQPQTG